MKIISLNAENFKRIAAVEITPQGNVVEIAGRNGQGKSSILDAIWVALAGLSAAPKQPIRKGELEAKIVLTLGTTAPEMVVTRTFRPSKDGGDVTSALKVESADGAKYTSPQAMLDKLLGALAFDPLAFERMDAREQFNALRAFVPGFDFEAIEAAQRGDYDRRTLQNRIAKEKRAAALSIKFDESLAAVEPHDERALVDELDNAGKHNVDIETRKANRAGYADKVRHLRDGAKSQRARAESLRAEAAALDASAHRSESEANSIDDRLKQAGALPEPIDTAALRAQIDVTRRANENIRQARARRDERAKLIAQAAEAEHAAAALTESIDMREIKKRDAIAAARLPVDGISFGDNEVLLGGVPFSQASDAERLVASMQMAMAMNPKLRIIRVRDGSLLDDGSMLIVADLATKHDYQVWIERVGKPGAVGILIEDGRVKMTSADKQRIVEPALTQQPTGKGDQL